MFWRSHAVSGLHFGRFRHAVYRHGGYRGASLAALALAFLAPAFSPARAESFSSGQKAEIEAIIKDYLLQKPEILREAIGVLEAREKVVSDPSGALFSAANQAVIGNREGKITLIEFFDYNCGYCKRALSDLARLMKDNPDLRVVLRDFPILSPGSVEAAKIANAFLRQFRGEKFWEFHQKLLGSRGPVSQGGALSVAKGLGAHIDKLAKDAAAPGITSGIEESGKLAKSLQVT